LVAAARFALAKPGLHYFAITHHFARDRTKSPGIKTFRAWHALGRIFNGNRFSSRQQSSEIRFNLGQRITHW